MLRTVLHRINKPALLLPGMFLLAGACAFAAEDSDVPNRISLWSTIAAGGIIGYIILLTSLVVLALVVEAFVNIRREKLIPLDLVENVRENLQMTEYARAREICEEDDSFLARILAAGLSEVGSMFGFFDMQNAMQEVSERNISKLYRRLDYLSFIAAVAPMMGLLGTVTGMIRSFNQIAITEGAAKPSQLAGGISEALVTTCLGLVVAIPAMFFATYFRNRIDSLIAEAEIEVERLMGRFRKGGAADKGVESA